MIRVVPQSDLGALNAQVDLRTNSAHVTKNEGPRLLLTGGTRKRHDAPISADALILGNAKAEGVRHDREVRYRRFPRLG
jgi:hypothetical protein